MEVDSLRKYALWTSKKGLNNYLALISKERIFDSMSEKLLLKLAITPASTRNIFITESVLILQQKFSRIHGTLHKMWK